MARTHKGGGPPRQLPISSSTTAATTAGSSAVSAQRSPLKGDLTTAATNVGSKRAGGGRQTVVLDAAMIRALVGDLGGSESARGRPGPSGKAAEVELVGFKCASFVPLPSISPFLLTPPCPTRGCVQADRLNTYNLIHTDKFKPSSVTNTKPGTFTLPADGGSGNSNGQAVVHLQGANKAEVHGFAAKVEETAGAATGRDVMLVWNESSQVRLLSITLLCLTTGPKMTARDTDTRACVLGRRHPMPHREQSYTMSPIARTYSLVHDKSLGRSHLPTASPFEHVRPASTSAASARPIAVPTTAMEVDVDGGLASSVSSDSSMLSVGQTDLPEALPPPPAPSAVAATLDSFPPAPAPPSGAQHPQAVRLEDVQPPAPPPQTAVADVLDEVDPDADAEGSTDEDDDDEDDDFAAQLEQELAALSGAGTGQPGSSVPSTGLGLAGPSATGVGGPLMLVGGQASNGRASTAPGPTDVNGKRPVSLNSLMGAFRTLTAGAPDDQSGCRERSLWRLMTLDEAFTGVADNESDSDGSSASSDSD